MPSGEIFLNRRIILELIEIALLFKSELDLILHNSFDRLKVGILKMVNMIIRGRRFPLSLR